jgi:hypothetical protein
MGCGCRARPGVAIGLEARGEPVIIGPHAELLSLRFATNGGSSSNRAGVAEANVGPLVIVADKAAPAGRQADLADRRPAGLAGNACR